MESIKGVKLIGEEFLLEDGRKAFSISAIVLPDGSRQEVRYSDELVYFVKENDHA